MKQFLYLIGAGIIGGISALSISNLTDKKIIIDPVPQVRMVSSGPSANFDFVHASAISTRAVVHIFALESQQLASQRAEEERQKRLKRRRSDPWSNFFGFGDNFYQPKEGSGSGVILSKDGYIVTNNHVVGFADNIRVTLSNGKEYVGTKIGVDPATDLAVIKIEANDLPTLQYADSENVQIGEWVLAVGNPFSYLKSTVTAGIVSAKGRDLDIIKGKKTIEEFIQTDAAVNPGNSGGALVNTEGKLVGINTAIATPTGVYAGYSFAIPSNLVKTVVTDILQRGGDIDRQVSLGILGYDVEEEIVKEFNLKTDSGFYIDEVERGGTAHLSGILPGDVVIEINKEKVDSYDVIKENMKLNKVGDVIVLKVDRNGETKKINIKLRKGL